MAPGGGGGGAIPLPEFGGSRGGGGKDLIGKLGADEAFLPKDRLEGQTGFRMPGPAQAQC